MVAYLFSQLHDVWAFAFWKKITKGQHKWIRNNLSTMSSQVIDTGLFTIIAFYGVVPGPALWGIATSQYIVKFIIAALDTPIFYLVSGHLERVFAEEEQALV